MISMIGNYRANIFLSNETFPSSIRRFFHEIHQFCWMLVWIGQNFPLTPPHENAVKLKKAFLWFIYTSGILEASMVIFGGYFIPGASETTMRGEGLILLRTITTLPYKKPSKKDLNYNFILIWLFPSDDFLSFEYYHFLRRRCCRFPIHRLGLCQQD